MKWKLEIANVRANERLLLKEHLDQMSERGWDLKRIGSFYLLYERAVDPCSWHIGFNDDATMLNAPRYIGISAANGETLRLGRAVLLIQEDRALYVHDQRGEQAYTESELLALIHEMAR